MTLTFLGKKSIAAAIPVLATLAAQFDLPDLQAQLLSLEKMLLSFTPPSISGIKLAIGDISAALPKVNLPAFDFKPPLIAFILRLKLKIDLLLKIYDLLAAAGVHAYVFEGKAAQMGGAFSAEFSPGPSQGGITGNEQVYTIALVVEASAGVTVSAVKSVFGA